MGPRHTSRILPFALGAGLACGTLGPAHAQVIDVPSNRVQEVESGVALPFALSPEDFRTGNLTPEQLKALQDYDKRLFGVAREIRDPALRATTLNRVARSKIIARDLEDAHTALREAGQAAMELQPGLIRDLRLMAITSSLVILAHEQVVQAVPNNPAILDMEPAGQRPTTERDAWLSMALGEWQRAAELAGHISNPNYRSEQLAKIVMGQASDALKVARDASRSATTRPDLEGQSPALFAYADRVLQQGAEQARTIDRAVWSDQALYEVAISAGRAGRIALALDIARSIPRPTPRAEALIEIAEATAREGSYVGDVARNGLETAYQSLLTTLATIRDDARLTATRARNADRPDDPEILRDIDLLAATTETRLAARMDTLYEQAETLRARAESLASQVERQFGSVPPARAASLQQAVQRDRSLARAAGELAEAVSTLRHSVLSRVQEAQRIEGAGKLKALTEAIPPEDDPALKGIGERVAATAQHSPALGDLTNAAATFAYMASARAVGSVPLTDQRAVSARLLTESLIKVGRFDDARAATTLMPDKGHRYAVLGAIAESQGRRGLADSAIRWIEQEAEPEYRARLYRRLEEGILATVDQIRTQTLNTLEP
jgi:ElaB/YqjD/DUF883 family membrane-anchored ribosome-binding protein